MSELTKAMLRLLFSGHSEERKFDRTRFSGSLDFAKSPRMSMWSSPCICPGFIKQARYELGQTPGYTGPHFAPSWKLPHHDFPAIKHLLLKLTQAGYLYADIKYRYTHTHTALFIGIQLF